MSKPTKLVVQQVRVPLNPPSACCASCQALSNSSDGTYLVLREPDSVPDELWVGLLAGCADVRAAR